MDDQVNLALLVLRVFFGVGLAYHGYNHMFRGGRLPGTARWFGSIGMKWPDLQARLSVVTEVGAGLLFAAGLITPFAAAGMIGVMVVAIWTVHRFNGFFIIKEGWEYTTSIALVAWAIATVGPGRYSLDNAFEIDWTGWTGSLIAGLLGVGGAVVQLALCYRQPAKNVVMTQVSDPTTDETPAKRSVWRIPLIVILAVFAAFWVWALFCASKEAVNKIDDRAWAERAEGICAAAEVERLELAVVEEFDPDDPALLTAHADIVDEATDIVEQMLDDVVAQKPTDAKGAAIVPLWEADYRTFIENRRAYTTNLRAGNADPFTETAVDGIPISEKVETFAGDNEMPSCAPPHEQGM